tara:strand:+ start:436 stop:567 length:132 start_codon:yes stop_codon:yes gene_type:complete
MDFYNAILVPNVVLSFLTTDNSLSFLFAFVDLLFFSLDISLAL